MKIRRLIETLLVITLVALVSWAALASGAALVTAELAPPAVSAKSAELADAMDAADRLNVLGLFNGIGTNPDGSPDFALDRAPSRAEAVTMVVRLVGREAEALCGNWTAPFIDVPDWAKPFVGYAYANELAFGVGIETFASDCLVTPSEYLTMILRALGYSSGTDFQWDKAWVLSDEIGITDGSYCSEAAGFCRGDIAEISFSALSAKHKETNETLCSMLIEAGVFTEDAASIAGLHRIAEAPVPMQEHAQLAGKAPDWPPEASRFEMEVFDLINIERGKQGIGFLSWDQELAGVARAHSMDMSDRGYFSHINPEGQKPADRKWDAGIVFTFSGENIARGYRTPAAVVAAWMNSPTHKAAILSETAERVGIGFHNFYWTVDFTR